MPYNAERRTWRGRSHKTCRRVRATRDRDGIVVERNENGADLRLPAHKS